jgi:hypothetical protein
MEEIIEFKDWFCIKQRESFIVDPKINFDDAKFYFGRKEIEEKIIKHIKTGFITVGAPKMVLYGQYGCGKTQTLYHIDWLLKNGQIPSKLKPWVVHVDLEMATKSTASILHVQLLEALGKNKVANWVNQLFNKERDIETKLTEIFTDENMVQAALNLRATGDTQLLAWRWFCGHKMTNADLDKLNITRSLAESGSYGDLVNALIGIGRLAELSDEKIIVLVDETEQLNYVTNPDATNSLVSYIRKLTDQTNPCVGIIFGIFAPSRQELGYILMRQDIVTRIINHNYIEIPPLPSVDDVTTFLKEMLNHFIDHEKAQEIITKENLDTTLEIYPFDNSSFEQLCEYASQDPTKALPRLIIRAVNECAVLAWDKKSRIIDIKSIEDISPSIFSED